MITINRLKLGSLLDKCSGKFVSITFYKKDGTQRRMVGRFGVKKHLRGGVNRVVNDSNSYVTIYDTESEGYRTVNLDTVIRLRANGNDYLVV